MIRRSPTRYRSASRVRRASTSWHCGRHYHRTPLRQATSGPTLRALQAYRRFLRERPSILAGDLNNHIRWDKPGKASNHANAVSVLDGLGMVSAYHAFLDLAPGAERHPTLYWRDRTEAGLIPRKPLSSYESTCPWNCRRLRVA